MSLVEIHRGGGASGISSGISQLSNGLTVTNPLVLSKQVNQLRWNTSCIAEKWRPRAHLQCLCLSLVGRDYEVLWSQTALADILGSHVPYAGFYSAASVNHPWCSMYGMYGIFSNICPTSGPNVDIFHHVPSSSIMFHGPSCFGGIEPKPAHLYAMATFREDRNGPWAGSS